MMEICDENDYDKMRWQPLFGKKTLQAPSGVVGVHPADVLVVSQLCFRGRWSIGGSLVVCP